MKKSVPIALLVAILVVFAGAAFATIPSGSGVINGCYKTNTGMLMVIDSSASCPSGSASLNWNQTGPAGATGATGPTGPSGAAGVSGYEVVQNTSYVTVNDGQVLAVAECPPGKVPLGGGPAQLYLNSPYTGQLLEGIVRSVPVYNPTAGFREWQVIWNRPEPAGTLYQAVVTVTCAQIGS